MPTNTPLWDAAVRDYSLTKDELWDDIAARSLDDITAPVVAEMLDEMQWQPDQLRHRRDAYEALGAYMDTARNS